jgi:hypothetical protein
MYLPSLMNSHVDNQLELAARTTATMMRAMGLTLGDSPQVPSKDEVRKRIELLVQEALDQIEQYNHPNPKAEIDVKGEADDQDIYVLVDIDENDKLNIEAWVRVN